MHSGCHYDPSPSFLAQAPYGLAPHLRSRFSADYWAVMRAAGRGAELQAQRAAQRLAQRLRLRLAQHQAARRQVEEV